MKQTGMLIVSLRGVNFGCLVSLRVSGKTSILSHQGLVYGCTERKRGKVNYNFLVFLVSFRGHKKLKSRPDWSPLGFEFKVSDKHPCLFHMGGPPPGIQLMFLLSNHLLNFYSHNNQLLKYHSDFINMGHSM